MTQSCLNDQIMVLQCKFATLSCELSKALNIGSKKILCYNRSNLTVSNILRILRCYTAFTTAPTYAYKVVFSRVSTGSSTVSMLLGVDTITAYTGTGTGEEIATYFEQQISNTVTTVAYETIIVGNILYIYSYDPLATFADTTTIVSNNTLVTVTTENLENELSEILNLWNSLTENEICNLITFATRTADDIVVSSPSSGSGCNC